MTTGTIVAKTYGMRRLVLLGCSFLFIGCGSADEGHGGVDGADGGDTAGEPAGAVSEGENISPGQLTAGAWDDNRNYEFFRSYLDEHGGLAGAPSFSMVERDEAQARSLEEPGPRETLDVALVIDTTGSMSDELYYLTVEFDALASRIHKAYPTAEQRWSLTVYRDHGDDYVVRATDFTSDLDAFQTALASESAGGGGDYPEAPDEGLAAATELSWRQGSTARLMFWLADAPHHTEDAPAMVHAARAAAERDVHIYPIAASGIDELTELTMRSVAQLTLGRYLFLTDDSGIGNSHKEPTIPCYYVTRLDDAILRMVDIEMSGLYREPSSGEIIRTGGDPTDGLCQLEGGLELVAF